MVGHRRDGRSGGSNDGLVGDPLVHLVDDLPHGLEVAELDVEGSDPVRCDAVGNVNDHALLVPSWSWSLRDCVIL